MEAESKKRGGARPGAGRKSLNPDGGAASRRQLSLPDALWAELDKEASIKGISVNEVIRAQLAIRFGQSTD